MKRIQSLTLMFLLPSAPFGTCYGSLHEIRKTKSSGNLLEKQNSNENYNSLENWSSKTVIVPRKHKKVDLYKADPHYEAMMNNNQDLKRQLKKTNSSKEILVSSVNDLVKKIKSNEKIIAESYLENAKKNEEIAQLTNKEREKQDRLIIINLKQMLENNKKDLNNIQDSLYNKEKNNIELSHRILILNNQNNKIETENQNSKGIIETLNANNKKLSSEVTALKENVFTLQSELKKMSIKSKIEKIVFETNKNQWIEEKNDYEEIINLLNKNLESLKKQLEKKSFESIVIEESDIDNTEELIAKPTSDNLFAQIMQENKTLQDKIIELNGIITQLNANFAQLDKELSSIETTNRELIKEKDQLFSEKKTLYNKITPLENEIGELKKKIRSLEGSNSNNFPDEPSCNNSELNSLKADNIVKNQKLQELQKQLGELQHALKQAKLGLDNSHVATNIEQVVEIGELKQTVNDLKHTPNQPAEIIREIYIPWTYKAATGFFALTTVVTAYIAYLFYKQKKALDAKQAVAQ